MKKTISVLLALLLLLGAVPFVPFAAAEESAFAAGDILEYGTYPQSLVTDEALLAALPQLPGEQKTFRYYGNEIGTGADVGVCLPFDGMSYIDVVFQNVKYRGVTIDESRPNTTPDGQESGYQAQNGYPAGNTYWFRFEPLRWRVIDPDSGLVVCTALIDSQPFAVYRNALASSFYTGEYGSITDSNHSGGWWETISVWLNEHFLTTAFSAAQQENILAEPLTNDYWYVGSGAGGNGAHRYDAPATADKIFLPAWDDLCSADAGFNTNGRSADAARALAGTDYAKAQGLGGSGAETAAWWTRTVSKYFNMNYDCAVNQSGAMSSAPANLKDTNAYYGVCPAMRLETLRNDAGGDALLHVGDLVHFGSYPQSKETDEAVIAALNERLPLAPQRNLTISEYRWNFDADYYTDYADLIQNGQKYRAKIEYTVMIREDTSTSVNAPKPKVYAGYDYSFTDGALVKYVWYYKFEPLTWRILDPENGLLMCNEIMESLVYQRGNYYDDYWDNDGWANEARTHYATDYTVSHIRDFLINDFWNTAFNDAQRAKIRTTEQDNRGMMTLRGTAGYERYDWETTDDPVFLLSSAQALNAGYGFDAETRKLQFTPYALENRSASDNYWVLRNAADNFFGRRPCGVFPGGAVGFTPAWSNDMHGVVPAVYVTEIENEVSGGCAVCSTHEATVVPVVPATCTAPGSGKAVCALCGEVLNESVVIPALGHDKVQHEGRAPTCGESGWAAYETCTRCDYTTYAALAPTGAHSWVWITDTAPTCSAAGAGHEACSVCGAVRGQNTTIDPTGVHVYTAAAVKEAALKSAAACAKNAVYYYSCKDCGAVEGNDSHTFEAEGTALRHVSSGWITDTPATCKRAGSKHTECTVCGAVLETAEIGRLPHMPKTVPGKAATCTQTGLTDGSVCDACGEVLKAQTVIPKAEHSWNAGVVTTQPTCTAAGVKTFTCVNCPATRTEQVPAKGHAWGGWVVTKQPTCTAEGQQTRTCTRDGSHKETQSVAKKPHTDNGSGYCRDCGADLKASQRCKYCGEIHTGPFAWLIRFFHNILAVFKR
ncbi:MAG: hypothetical protein II804_04255 [Clostridia bacterium]|nr:hypothetical protein [Clostridia bacterium]